MSGGTASGTLRTWERIAILLLACAANGLALTGLSRLNFAGAALLLYLLPGWALMSWAIPLEGEPERRDNVLRACLQRLTLSIGLSLALSAVALIVVHYIPGPLTRWQVLAALDVLVVACLAGGQLRQSRSSPTAHEDRRGGPIRLALICVTGALLRAAFYRFTWLGYSEFQGDEALVTWASARAIVGEDDILFLHGKSPAEVVLPAAQWVLDGRLNEATARFPFALAGWVAAAGAYLLGRRLFGERAGWLALFLFAINGYFIGFARIVQYQSLVLVMGVLGVYTAYLAVTEGRDAYQILSALFLGAGLLAHYDGLLAVLPVLFLWAARIRRSPAPASRRWLIGAGALLLTVGVAAIFYLPLLRDAQFAQMLSYLSGSRVGHNLLNNHLPFLLLSGAVYNSTYYTALLAVALLGVWIWTLRWLPGRAWTGATLMALLATTAAFPGIWQVGQVNLALAPFALAIGLAVCAPGIDAGRRAIWLWLGVAGGAYIYVLALPLSHLYAVMPAWVLLAAYGLHRGLSWVLPATQPAGNRRLAAGLLGIAALIVLTVYPYLVFVRHDPEFARARADRPLSFYWQPYTQLPAVGLFGFPHRSGWKAIGNLYDTGTLAGDYLSNEEEWVTLWYTHFAPRSCQPEADTYFIAENAWDPTPAPGDLIAADYTPAGTVTVGGDRRIGIYKRKTPESANENLKAMALDVSAIEDAYDQGSQPQKFVQKTAPQVALPVDFGEDIRLLGYDLEETEVSPGGRLALTLYWQARQPPKADYHVFVQLGDGTVWAQNDSAPVCGRLPTTLWRPGQVIVDRHRLDVDPQAAPGRYPLRVGVYRPGDGQRLAPAPGDDSSHRAVVAEIGISP